MPKPLTTEQLQALRAVPLGDMPNKLRIALTLAQARSADVVDETGLDAGQVSRILNGKVSNIEIDTARKFAAFFDCFIEDLFPARQAVA